MNLRQIGEDRLVGGIISRLESHARIVAGAGDDCAVVKSRAGQLQLLKTDCLVEGIHFKPGTKAAAVGWKAMMRPLSDFAAMSGMPEFALITLIAPGATKVDWVRDLFRGLEKAARRFGVRIVGGETSAIDRRVIVSVAVSGFVERDRWVSREDGRIHDDLFVTGRLGGSLGGKHLCFVPRIEEARWLTKNFSIHAMMDLSDGLGADLPRLARASKVGFVLNERALPLNRGCTIEQGINDGEDYELLFALSPRDRLRLEKRWKKYFPKLLLTRIGRLDKRSRTRGPRWRGYVHFA